MMKLRAVKATLDMADTLGYVHAMSWQKAYAGIVPDEILAGFTQQKRAEVFRKALATRPEEIYLFYAGERPAGLAMLHQSHEEGAARTDGEVYAIYFHPDFWGQGYARQAMQFCLERLNALGYCSITVWVLEANYRARGFYEKCGFALDGAETEIVLGKPLKELRYRQNL